MTIERIDFTKLLAMISWYGFAKYFWDATIEAISKPLFHEFALHVAKRFLSKDRNIRSKVAMKWLLMNFLKNRPLIAFTLDLGKVLNYICYQEILMRQGDISKKSG